MSKPTIEELVAMYDDYFAVDKGKWVNDTRNRLAYEAVTSFIPEPVEVLDAGMGNGHTLAYFRTRHSTAKLYGLDLSQVAADIAREKLPEAEIYVGDLLSFTSRKKWEVIVSLGSIEHLLDPDAGLAKLNNLLKKDGIVYIELPDNLAYSKGAHEYRKLRTGSHQWEWHLSREEWEAKFLAAGFTIKKAYTRAQPQWRFGWVLE